MSRRADVAFLLCAAWSATGCVNGTLPRRAPQHPGHPGAAEGYTAAQFSGLVANGSRDAAMATQAEPAMLACPMHPEVVSSTPGTCPKCGMNLVPKPVSPKHYLPTTP